MQKRRKEIILPQKDRHSIIIGRFLKSCVFFLDCLGFWAGTAKCAQGLLLVLGIGITGRALGGIMLYRGLN